MLTSTPLAYCLAKADDTRIKIKYKIMDMPMYLALHKEMDYTVIKKSPHNIDQMHSEGKLDAILTKYGIN